MLGTVKGTEVLCMPASLTPLTRRSLHMAIKKIESKKHALVPHSWGAAGFWYLHWIHTRYIVICFPRFTCSRRSTRFWIFSRPVLVKRSSNSSVSREREIRMLQLSFNWYLLTLRAKQSWKMGQRKLMVSVWQGNANQTGLNCCGMGGLRSQSHQFPLSLLSTKEGKKYCEDNLWSYRDSTGRKQLQFQTLLSPPVNN